MKTNYCCMPQLITCAPRTTMRFVTMFSQCNGCSSAILFLLLILVGFLFPGMAFSHGNEDMSQLMPSAVSANLLPGVTWTDDIHPIFIRNKCYNCHTRGKEDSVEGLSEFSLGLVDDKDPGNSYYSFHELVYTEGPPNIIDGEVLRDGQCCWPSGFSPDQQRRIWLGHPERSALLHKLDRDYYDWNKPPRYLEEGLRLSWGLPMPMWKIEDKDNAHESFTPSLWKEIVLRGMLLIGRGQDKIKVLENPIPASDRALIREWINNNVQLRTEGTAINIKLATEKGQPIAKREINLVGNFVLPSHTKIRETYIIKTDGRGLASLKLPVGSVVSLTWYIGIMAEHEEYRYQAINIVPGEINDLAIHE